jgi:hypothetical protein
MATLFYPTKILRYGYRQSGLLDLCDAGVLSDVLQDTRGDRLIA